jgi:ribonuclease BN (tRNA processing enzyme)
VMKLTVVGNSGSYPGPDSPASCYLLTARHHGRDFNILLDLGNGALGALQRHLDPAAVDVNPDHAPPRRSLPRPVWLLCAAQISPTWRDAADPRLRAQAHPRRLARSLWFEPGTRDARGVRLQTLSEGELPSGPFKVTARRVNHPVPAYALRVEADGKALPIPVTPAL